MCGISGVILNNADTFLYQKLLRASEIRGKDGTGIASLDKDKGIIARHFDTPASEVTFSSFWKDASFLIGQNRLSVFGLTPDNHQPLVNESRTIALVHNGNLINYNDAFEQYSLPRKYKVDTELILRLLEVYLRGDHSIEEIIHMTTSRLKGDFACMALINYYDIKALLVFNRYKPIIKYEHSDGNIYFFSTPDIGKAVFGDTTGFVEYPNNSFDIFKLTKE